MARFKVKYIFTLADIGQVLAGEILEGEVSAGDLIRILVNDSALIIRIKSVELVNDRGKTDVGLLIGFLDNDVQEKLAVIAGRAVSIVKTH
jgi:hypothetical protein